MTPEQKIKWAILAKDASWQGQPPPPYPCEDVDERFDALVETERHWDAISEVRCGGVETGLKCPLSRHYESNAVAMQMPDGSWVGWTYWYGGGKHGCPDEIEWMSDAYDVQCKEEEKLVISCGRLVKMSKLIEKAQAAGDFILLEDGYYTWWPRSLGGAVNAANLRELADELDRINAAWDAQVRKDLEEYANAATNNNSA